MADLGYDIESINFVKYANGVYGIALHEKDIKNNINQLERCLKECLKHFDYSQSD